MKVLKFLAVFLFSFLLGAFSAGIYYNNEIANINEDIISKEVQLLSLVSNNSIPCDKLKGSNEWVQENKEGHTVFWKLFSDGKQGIKVVVDKDHSTAAETFSTSCPKI